MKVSGYNESYRLGGSLNNNISNTQDIKFPGQSCLDISLLLSFSTYQHPVWINQKGEAFAVGDSRNGKISSELQKKKFETDTKIDSRLKNGHASSYQLLLAEITHFIKLQVKRATTLHSLFLLLQIKKQFLSILVNGHHSHSMRVTSHQ